MTEICDSGRGSGGGRFVQVREYPKWCITQLSWLYFDTKMWK